VGEASATVVSGENNNLKPPPPAPTPPVTNESDGPTDNAVNAINALSNLQSRWSAPGAAGKPQENESKNQKRKKRKRPNKKHNHGSSSDNPIVICDTPGGKSNVVWIDVEDGPSVKRKQSNGQKEFDLVSGVAEDKFPSLASRGGDDVRLVTLKDVSTSQLTSYASVLGRALGQNDGANNRASKNQDVQSLGDDDDEEMDISDEEEEEEVHSKSKEEIQPKPDTRPVTLPPSNQELEINEKEKRALKLAELRAKAKLARAKLRIAEQKKARGNVASLSSAVSTSPLPTKLADITALCDNGSLVIEDVSLTGPANEVRFVDSVYSLQEFLEDDQIQDSNNSINYNQVPAQDKTATTPSEENRKKSESLKQKLQLARLRLEIKKKELERKGLEKKRALAAVKQIDSKQPPLLSANRDSAQNQPLPLSNQGDQTQLKEENVEGEGNAIMVQNSDSAMNAQDQQPDIKQGNEEAIYDAPSHVQTQVKLEQLRSRQKELKQKNDIANMRNLIHKQRDMLQAQGQELTESSTQLQSCVDSIKSKQKSMDEADHKLEEMSRRKRIIEGMVFRATEQLIAARKVLSERRNQNRKR